MEAKVKTGYMLFNCDEEKNPASMNPQYNAVVFRDTRDNRRKLWKAIKKNLEESFMKAHDSDIVELRELILSGDPIKANTLIKYGYIQKVTVY